ncbi:MAG: alpha/beta hydrolase, partial [Deltaproteobacteria bacterium]|nr:alpha/beta hydrolase [Deltaproteobacteria bacterium]
MSSPHITGRQKAVTQVISATLTSLAYGGKVHPTSRRWMDDVEVFENIPYKNGFGPQHKLNVYKPKNQTGPLPVMFYVHGGGFSLLSKDTHWMFGAGFARQGYVVFSIDYTLSGEEPFPAAVKDTFAAYEWVAERALHYDGDVSRMVVSGESAGANLSLALVMAMCWKRPEPWAQGVWETAGRIGVAKAALPACGMLQVSNPERYLAQTDIPAWMRDRIAVVCRRYLPDASGETFEAPPYEPDEVDSDMLAPLGDAYGDDELSALSEEMPLDDPFAGLAEELL